MKLSQVPFRYRPHSRWNWEGSSGRNRKISTTDSYLTSRSKIEHRTKWTNLKGARWTVCATIPIQKIIDTATSLFSDKVRLVAPVVMGPACVSCHNAHPESPKTDWKVGDVRGIQEVVITQPIAANLFSFKYLLAYFVLAAISGISFLGTQRRQAMRIKGINRELELANDFLATLSMKISRYISPQVYKSIFSGQKDVTIHTERKKLTIFFSDIQNFTATTERLQPELITQLLNEYFTEMSTIAHEHGGKSTNLSAMQC